MASIGGYVLTPDIFEILRGQAPGAGGEIQLADAINTQAAAGQVEAETLDGQRFDCGSVKGVGLSLNGPSSDRPFARPIP